MLPEAGLSISIYERSFRPYTEQVSGVPLIPLCNSNNAGLLSLEYDAPLQSRWHRHPRRSHAEQSGHFSRTASYQA